MLTLTSDVSQSYFELLGLRFELEIAQETAQSYTATLKLFTEPLQGGIGNTLQTWVLGSNGTRTRCKPAISFAEFLAAQRCMDDTHMQEHPPPPSSRSLPIGYNHLSLTSRK